MNKNKFLTELFEAMDNRHYRTLSAFRSSTVKYCNTGVIKNVDWDGEFFTIKAKTDV